MVRSRLDATQITNAALGAVMRLNDVLNLCATYALQMDMLNWYQALRQLLREVGPKISKEELSTYRARLKTANENISTKPNRTVNGTIKVNPEVYDELDNIDVELRCLADKNGLLIPREVTLMDAMKEDFLKT